MIGRAKGAVQWEEAILAYPALPSLPPLNIRELFPYGAGAVLTFHAAYGWPEVADFMIGYLFCLIQLARATSRRQAWYAGLIVGLLCFGPRLGFFWRIFGPGAIALWYVLAFWTALFVTASREAILRWGPARAAALLPFLWTGFEYFRSELYYLRFSWLNIGYAFSGHLRAGIIGFLGMYGIGFGVACVAAVLFAISDRFRREGHGARVLSLLLLVMFAPTLGSQVWSSLGPTRPFDGSKSKSVAVAGVQLEFPTEDDVLSALNKLAKSSPETRLFVLSEYTFQDVVPPRVRRWCREHQSYLIAGGKEPAGPRDFYNTAFVVGPTGEVVFRQAKKVPIQFFKDGRPALGQKLWESPWGRIGICICYDLSYTRVTDALVRAGAQALIVPTMDVADWGRDQHEMHARVAPLRAAEYGIPIFRVASSGFSQLVGSNGRVAARAGFPGDHETLGSALVLGPPGTLPIDRWLAPFATLLTGTRFAWMMLHRRRKASGEKRGPDSTPG